MSDDAPLLIDRPEPGVLRLRLNRPGVRNAIDGTLVELALEAIAEPEARVVLLGSSDPAAFSSGIDLAMDAEERRTVSDRLYEVCERMVTSAATIVAAVSGFAVGGGANLAVASDLRVGHPSAVFRFAGPGHGLSVGSWALPSLVGRGRALDLCLTMRGLGAEEALRIGLLDRVEDDPWAAALALASAFAKLDGDAAARVKRVAVSSQGLVEALRLERKDNRETWDGSVGAPSPGPVPAP